MPAHAAVGVHDDLAAGDAAIALRAADDEAAGRVHVVDRALVQQLRRHRRLDHLLDDFLADLLVRDVRGVLGRNDDGVHAHGLAVRIVFDGHLALGIGTDPRHLAGLAQVGQLAHDPVGQDDRQRHQLGGFVAGVAEHHALVAGALLGRGLAFGLGGVHALGDVRRLAFDGDEHRADVGVEAGFLVVVADVDDGLASHFGVVDDGLGGDFAGDDDHAGLGQAFAGHAAFGILGQTGVQDRIRHGVAQLVGMAFGHGFGGEHGILGHGILLMRG